jgi:hypothetical protein
MKYARATIVYLLASVLAVASLAFAGPAFAGTLPHNFVDDNGKVFSIDGSYQVEKVANAVQVTARNGTTYPYADASGALHVKLVNYMATTKEWYRLPGTLIDMNTVEVLQITCYSSGTQTAFSYGNYSKFVPDNCAALTAIAAQSN